MAYLRLTAPEAEYLAVVFSAEDTEHVLFTEEFDSVGWRVKMVAAALDAPVGLEMTLEELLMVDHLLIRNDPRASKLSDGTPVLGLLKRVWAAVAQEGYNANGSTHENAYGHADGDRAQATV